MTVDLVDGCTPVKVRRACGVQSRRAATAKGSLRGGAHEAFEPVGPLGVMDSTNRVVRAGRTWRFPTWDV